MDEPTTTLELTSVKVELTAIEVELLRRMCKGRWYFPQDLNFKRGIQNVGSGESILDKLQKKGYIEQIRLTDDKLREGDSWIIFRKLKNAPNEMGKADLALLKALCKLYGSKVVAYCAESEGWEIGKCTPTVPLLKNELSGLPLIVRSKVRKEMLRLQNV